MRPREIVKVFLGLFCAGVAAYALLPRVRNDYSCDSSAPTNAAQTAALADARARKAKVCQGSQGLCKFEINQDSGGLLRVSLYFVESNVFDGCILKDQDIDVFVYTREGALVRIEGAPFAYQPAAY